MASGIRIAELVALNLVDLNIKERTCRVLRKGGIYDVVHFAPFAKEPLENYLSVRVHQYKNFSNESALFLAFYGRISDATVNNLVAKYSESYNIRLTPHMLRHTLATRLYAATKSQTLVANQLGHSSTATSELYTHVLNNEIQDALDNL